MKKGAEAFRSIGEVASLIGVAPHVLRYWETQFSLLKPMKRPDGRRYYRPEDVRLAAGLCEVLREDGMTIRGARKMLARDRGQAVRDRGAERLAQSGAPLGITPAASDAAPRPATVPPVLARDDPDPLPQEDLPDMAPHSPRSRHRHRRRGPESGGALPLFPDLDATARDEAWLANLVALSCRLRALPAAETRTVAQLAALRDSIATLY